MKEIIRRACVDSVKTRHKQNNNKTQTEPHLRWAKIRWKANLQASTDKRFFMAACRLLARDYPADFEWKLAAFGVV